MTDPIITEADEAKARAVWGTTYHAIAAALAQARAEGRLAGMEEERKALSALLEDHAAEYGTMGDAPLAGKHTKTNRLKLQLMSCGLTEAARLVRARTTKEG